MNRTDVQEVICATDAGREGELIFRLVYHQAGCSKPFKRLWVNSMEDDAIRAGFEHLKNSSDYDRLYEAALCRSKADWLVGMNGTRLYSTLYDTRLSVGRVQTPTLAMVVERSKALNQKYYQEEDINDNLTYLLKNLCFSINSDIVLFLALITNNTKFLNIIIDEANKHFDGQQELSFDTENVKFLLETSVPVKNNLPSAEERKERERVLAKQEEDVKLSDLIELVNEYDYSDEDLLKMENQIMISFKYLEILSKALPAFCNNMKAPQQDRLVSLIYKCPNQFLYSILKDISDNFEEFCNEVYEDVSALRKEKNIVEANIDSVRRLIEQISAVLVMALYQVVAVACTSDQTIEALSAFPYNENSNYMLQNLMMMSRVSPVALFSKRAQELNKDMKNKIEKSIIKYVVREYLLRNCVEIYGEAQSMVDCFFGGKSNKEMRMEIAKRRIMEKDRI